MSIAKITKTFLGLVLTAALFLPAAPVAAQSGYRVVVNNSNTVSSMAEGEVAKLFLKKTTKWDSGLKVQPVDQAPSRSVRQSFTRSVHGKRVSSIKAYWQKMIFSGRSTPPSELDSDAQVLEYVRRNPRAIGYVSAATSLGGGVKVLHVTDG